MEKQFDSSLKNNKLVFVLAAVGVLLLALGAVLANADAHQWWANVLVNGAFFIGLAGFAALFVAAHTLADSGWHVGIMRIPEAIGSFLPVGGLLMLLIIPGIHSVYHWSHPGTDALLIAKSPWLNVPFFIVRTVLYVAIWALLFMRFRKISLQFDSVDNVLTYKKFKIAAAIFAVGFVFTFYISAWDWLMSVDPHWYSTIYSFFIMAGMLVSAVAATSVLLLYLVKRGYYQMVLTSVFSDLGSYLFAFSVFWGYLWGAQYLLIWYSNIPEEAVYYTQRLEQYPNMFYIVVFLNVVVPFIGLLSRKARKNLRWVAVISGVILIGQWLNMFLLVMPGASGKGVSVGAIEIGMGLIYLAIFMGVVLKALSKAKTVPEHHPFLIETESH